MSLKALHIGTSKSKALKFRVATIIICGGPTPSIDDSTINFCAVHVRCVHIALRTISAITITNKLTVSTNIDIYITSCHASWSIDASVFSD